MNDICVIIPTVRRPEVLLSYYENALKYNFDFSRVYSIFITEDFADKDKMRKILKDISLEGDVFGQSEREKWFEENNLASYVDVIPKRSHAETSFGLLFMWANDFEVGIFIDDDTIPHPDFDFFGFHICNLNFNGKLPCLFSNKKFVNVLYQSFGKYGLYPRGFPYSARGEKYEIRECEANSVR